MKNVYQVTFEVQCKVYIFILSYAEYSLPREMKKKIHDQFFDSTVYKLYHCFKNNFE